MRNLFIFILVLIASVTFSQSTDLYVKKGYAYAGYDVVSYFKGKPMKGSEEYVTAYRDAKVKFSSKENLTIFLKNPDKFVPQFGGWCAYAIAKNNKNFKINPKSYLIEEGKLYLFYSTWLVNTKKKWNKNGSGKLRKQAHDNWSKREKATK